MHQQPQTAFEFRRRRIAERLCTYINREPQNNDKFIKDIIPNSGIETANQIITAYNRYNPSQKTKVFIIGFHEEEKGQHIHFYHNCRYTQRNCRCGFIDNIQFKRREPKHIIDEHPFKEILFENIINYLSKERRQLIHIQIGPDSLGETIHRFKNLRLTESSGDNSSDGTMEACYNEMQDGSRKRNSTFIDGTSETKRIKRIIDQGYDDLSERRAGGRTNQKSEIVDFLVMNILKVLATPIEAACNTDYWSESKFLSIYNSKNSDYELACSSIMRLTSQLSFEEIYQLHTAKGCLNYYCARNKIHYYSIEDSIKHIEKLLDHQYNGDYIPFLSRLFDVCERKIPKRNSLFVKGGCNK